MKVFLTDTVAAHVTQSPLGWSPRFCFSGPYVVVAPYADTEEREHDLTHTFGSMQWLWSENDDFRFSRPDRQMHSLVLHAPEVADPAPAISRAWTERSVITGGLQAESESQFSIPQTVVRWCDRDSTYLVCLQEGQEQPHRDSFRLRIAPETDLLFQDQRLVGWMLTNPAHHLTMAWENAESSTVAPSTRSLLVECLKLTAEPLVDDVIAGEESAWQRLHETVEALHRQTSDHTRIRILAYTMNHLVKSSS
jgi:hypothetical protein